MAIVKITHSTVYSLQCTVFIVQIVHYTVFQCPVYSIQCAVFLHYEPKTMPPVLDAAKSSQSVQMFVGRLQRNRVAEWLNPGIQDPKKILFSLVVESSLLFSYNKFPDYNNFPDSIATMLLIFFCLNVLPSLMAGCYFQTPLWVLFVVGW